MTPLPFDAFERRTGTAEGGDLAGALGMREELPEKRTWLVPRVARAAGEVDAGSLRLKDEWRGNRAALAFEVPDAALPRAVVFRDSFGTHLIPFLSEHFARVVYIWDDFHRGLIEHEQPDVVIDEIVERMLLEKRPESLLR